LGKDPEMKNGRVLLILLLICCLAETVPPVTASGILTEWYVNPSNGHEYALWGYGTWIAAYNACPADAHLVTFSDAVEEAWVWSTFLAFIAPNYSVPESDRYRFYIGLTDSEIYGASEGNWKWVTGEPVSYTHWGVGEPNDSWMSGEDFAETIRPGNYWNDLGTDTFFFNTQAIFERDTLLHDGRFEVVVDWLTPTGSSGKGLPVPLTTDSGYFWFFEDTNIELLVKIKDGCEVNGYYWFFYGALTDVEYTITVTDTETSAVKTYHGTQHVPTNGNDINAFACP